MGAPVNCSGGMNDGRSQHLAGGGDLAGHKLGDAEVGDAGPLAAINLTRGQQDIGGLDIAVNHALAVRVAESFSEMLADLADAVERKPLAFFHGVGEGRALDKFHHQKGRALMLAHVEDGHNAGMRQNARGARLALEACAVLFALRAFERGGMDGFDGDDAAYGGVACLENAAHRAASQLLDNLVAVQ